MDAECSVEAGRLIHVFEVERGAPPPREQSCDCGDVTWGEMDDLLMLTRLWEVSVG